MDKHSLQKVEPDSTALKSASMFGLGRVVRAVGYSSKGLVRAWHDEAAFRQEVLLFAVFLPATVWLGLPLIHTVVLIAMMGIVLSIELLNSGLEALVDKTSPELHPLAGKAKDCGSAAVFVSMITLSCSWLALAGPAVIALFRAT